MTQTTIAMCLGSRSIVGALTILEVAKTAINVNTSTDICIVMVAITGRLTAQRILVNKGLNV